MTHENEAHRNWHVVPSVHNQPGWFTVGYTYEGPVGRHQGEFVPVHHWADKGSAEAYCAVLLAGGSRGAACQAGNEA